jgi:hypothetical protein
MSANRGSRLAEDYTMADTHRRHREIRDQFRAFRLDMMFGHPEGVVAALVHAVGVGHHLVQRLRQLSLAIAAGIIAQTNCGAYFGSLGQFRAPYSALLRPPALGF